MTAPQIVFDEWNAYPAERDGVMMFISFDVAAAGEDRPADLPFCARVQIPIASPNAVGGPDSPEAERLWSMQDGLVEHLLEHRVRCRLVGRLTYGGLREIVFQLEDWETFRTPVGLWMLQHEDYDIDVSEHDGWDFFDEYLSPRIEDQLFMADSSVVEALVEAGSDPEKEHSLEFVFVGDADALRQVADALRERGYRPEEQLDLKSGQIVLAKRMPLDVQLIVEESLANYALAEEAGVEFDGWGAAVVP